MADLAVALSTALEATHLARQVLLAECARPDGPRGEIGHCPADDEAELAIRRCLLDAFPTWGYLGEETAPKPAADGAEYVWIVDPNDGTTTMQRGYRGHAISIGLTKRGVPVLGVVCAVDAPDDDGDLIAWAEGCGPIRRNGREVRPRTWEAALSTADVVGLSQGVNRNPVGYLASIRPARAIGMPSIAYRLALVATGEFAATVSLNYLSAWDYAAGHALVRAAGGVMVDEHGKELTYTSDAPSSTSRVFAGGRAVVDNLVRRSWEGVSRSGFGPLAPPADTYPVRARPGRLIHDTGALGRAHGCLLGLLASGDSSHVSTGQPTSEGELALALARTLVADADFDPQSVAATYAQWRSSAPAKTSTTALVRAGPIGIWGARRNWAAVAAAARADAAITHSSRACVDASAVLAVTLAAAIRQGLDPVNTHQYAVDWSRTHDLDATVQAALYEAKREPLDGLQNAFYHLLHTATLQEAVAASVRCGGDIDTSAALCGALFGAVHGRRAVPAQWQRALLSCRPTTRPAQFWPTDALLLAERLLDR